MSLTDRGLYWDLPIIGFEVLQVLFSGRLAISAYGQAFTGEAAPTTQISLGGPFVYVTPESEELHLDASGDWQYLTPMLGLRGARIVQAQAGHESNLLITFENPLVALIVVPDAKYENWEISGPGRLNLVSPPGGGDPRIAT